MGDPHIDLRGKKRKGWFNKGKDKKPEYKSFRSSCEQDAHQGYLGPRYEAHHILPQTCIEESIEDDENDRDPDYVYAIQFMTEWNINNPNNLIGLPHVHAYMLAYQRSAKLKAIGADDAGSVKQWSKFLLQSRKNWLKAALASPPELPIHQPVSWGHSAYNDDVQTDLVEVWNNLTVNKKAHELTANALQSSLVILENKWCRKLKARGTPDETDWNKIVDGDDDANLKSFTMADVRNPLA